MAKNDPPAHTLRRAWFSGYNAADVEVLLGQLSLKDAQLQGELDSLRARLETAEAERRELTRLLDEAHRRELELKGAAVAARHEADELLAAARDESARLRTEAELDAGRVRSQVDELLQLRETLTRTMRSFIREYGRIVEGGGAAAEAPREADAPEPEPAPAPAPPAGPLFDRAVEVDAGPFYDFESLSAFERALASLPHVADAYVRRFSDDRATIELTLEQPTPLLADIASLPYALSVGHADNRIELDVGTPNHA